MRLNKARVFNWPEAVLVANEDTVYAIRCFRDGDRKLTDKLTKDEAYHFRQAALHLSSYLTREYGLSGQIGGRARATDKPPD